jgi:hypothetical protein
MLEFMKQLRQVRIETTLPLGPGVFFFSFYDEKLHLHIFFGSFTLFLIKFGSSM